MERHRLFGPDAPPPKRILVTGGAGFVGHSIVNQLLDRGLSVRVLDPGPPHPLWNQIVDHHRADLLHPTSLTSAIRGIDLIFHTAGLWDGSPGGRDRMFRLNVDGTQAVLNTGIPTVYTSSSITCGFGPLNQPGTEDEPNEDPLFPLQGTPHSYRATKLIAEEMVREAAAWMVNPDYVVGPGDVHGVVTTPLIRAAQLPLIPAPKGGKCFVSGSDVAAAHLLVPSKGTPGRRYLIGAENRSYADIFRTIAKLIQKKPVIVPLPRTVARVLKRLPRFGPTGGAIEQMGLARYRSNGRAQAELGWAPFPIQSALAAMLDWHQQVSTD